MDKDKILIVGYGASAHLVTTDREEAEEKLAKCQAEYPVLAWGIRSIKEPLSHAWSDGYDTAEDTHAELDAGESI